MYSENADNTKEIMPENAEQRSAKKELKQAIDESYQVLASATTVFPFTPFPDTLTLDRAKVTIKRRNFFRMAELMSMRVEDLLNVTASVGPLFGSIKIVSRVFSNNEKPYEVNHFWRDDALKLKRIMQGYIIAMQKEIDCNSLETKELAEMLEKLGKDDH
jgi:hypothetical protein